MRRKATAQILPLFASLLLTLSLLAGLCTPMALAAEATPDRNILAYALTQAHQAVADGTVAGLVPSVQEKLNAALAAAEAVYAKEDASREDLQQSYKSLQEVIWLFSYKQADKAALRSAIARAEATDLTGCSASKIKAVGDALAAAKVLDVNAELSVLDQAAVDAAAAALVSALDAPNNSGGGGGGGGGGTTTKPTEPEKPAEPTPVTERFPDIKEGAWYVSAVQYVVDNDLMQGTSDGFSPGMEMSRAMLMTVLYRMAGAPEQSGAQGTAWYSTPMAWGVSVGITDGTNPECGITREQIAVLLFRYTKPNADSADLSVFTDADQISGWAKDAVSWAVRNELISGKGSGILDPQGLATRAEVAAILARFDQMNKKA